MSADLSAQKVSDSEREVVQAANCDGFVVDALPDGGKIREEEIEQAKNIGHVEGYYLHNWLCE